jgi:hypothetical protein
VKATSSKIDVLVPAVSFDLTTLEVVKDEFEIAGNDLDIRWARWIREESRTIARWCNRIFAQEQVSETWRGADRWGLVDQSLEPRPLLLCRYPVVRIDSITDTETVLPATSYEVDTETGRLWRLTDDGSIRSHWWPTTLTVVYSGGYELPGKAPDELAKACLMLLKNRRDGITRDRLQRSQNIPGVLEEQWWNPATPGQPGMPPDVAEVLNGFREYNAP